MVNNRIQYLVERHFQNACTPQEKVELAQWIEESSHDEELKKILDEKWASFEGRHKISSDKAVAILDSILKKEQFDTVETIPSIRRINWWKISIAASIILVLSACLFFLSYNRKDRSLAHNANPPAKNLAKPANDVNPGKTKAVLTLSDGSQVVLDTRAAGTLAVEGDTKISNQTGELIYKDGIGKNGELIFNTLTTSRGEQYPLNLSDGTRIWLNSASSIRFPVTFPGDERKVEITGEAYFEVAKNAKKPFKVQLNGMEITVLGTHFNVNGYADEANVKTTLLEGSVRVSKGQEVMQLLPGQQAKLNKNGKLNLVKDADLEAAVAWKDGYFHFDKTDLETVMRDLSRWYDVDIIYENGKRRSEQFFSGDIQKSLSLSAVLRVLEKSLVHFRIEGKKLIVMP